MSRRLLHAFFAVPALLAAPSVFAQGSASSGGARSPTNSAPPGDSTSPRADPAKTGDVFGATLSDSNFSVRSPANRSATAESDTSPIAQTPTPEAAPQEPPPEPPPSPGDVVPEVSPPTRPGEAPARLVPHEHETPADETRTPARDSSLRQEDLSLELGVAMTQRLGNIPGFQREERLDFAYALGLWLAVMDKASLGLELQHRGLGSGSDQTGGELVRAEYSTTMAWLSGRFVPWRSVDLEAFVALRLGIGLEHVSADGVRQTGSPFESPRAFACSETDGPGFGLGGGLGAALGLGKHLRLLGRLDADAQKLPSDVMGGCAVGIGSTTSVSLGIGLAYGFDVGTGSSDPFASRAPAQTW